MFSLNVYDDVLLKSKIKTKPDHDSGGVQLTKIGPSVKKKNTAWWVLYIVPNKLMFYNDIKHNRLFELHILVKC